MKKSKLQKMVFLQFFLLSTTPEQITITISLLQEKYLYDNENFKHRETDIWCSETAKIGELISLY